ncbi:hypothetical protein LSM04_005542 [Trypanosoma melophagium]|uniref:uncharacterized protein n=1 Tax=Trypanosoma melophagium TaxID=715481 RepID=UPI00351A43B8|nr:hypothetical protein LSM04_005542 [Trypanosoma melophagium]
MSRGIWTVLFQVIPFWLVQKHQPSVYTLYEEKIHMHLGALNNNVNYHSCPFWCNLTFSVTEGVSDTSPGRYRKFRTLLYPFVHTFRKKHEYVGVPNYPVSSHPQHRRCVRPWRPVRSSESAAQQQERRRRTHRHSRGGTVVVQSTVDDACEN